jgi:DNA-binding Xre family transcriptional regulator
VLEIRYLLKDSIMLELDITRIIGQQSTESPAAYLHKRGFTKREVRSLSHPSSMKQIRDQVIQRLCETLHCTPNDLFRWKGALNPLYNKLNGPAMSHACTLLGTMNQEQVDTAVSKALELASGMQPVTSTGQGRLWLNVGHAVAQRQQPQPLKFLKQKGFTEMQGRKLLSSERKSIRLAVLSRLCVVLGCLPNDLFDWEGSEEHHLNVLRKPAVVDLKGLLEQLPPDKVRRVLGELGEIGD